MVKILKKLAFYTLLFLVYLVSTVPVGLFLYTLKSDQLGINIFSKTGFHAYLQCLQEQAYKIEIQEKALLDKTRPDLETPE